MPKSIPVFSTFRQSLAHGSQLSLIILLISLLLSFFAEARGETPADQAFLPAFEAVDPAVLESMAEEDFRNFKVVGRGIRDRNTGQVLKLACVGKRLRKTDSERKCDVLNFLYTDYSGVTRLIGAPFTLRDGSKMQDQLQYQLRKRGLQDNTMAHSRTMAYTRALFNGERASWWVVAFFGGGSLLGGLPILGAAAVGFGSIIVPDVLILPFSLVEDAQFRNPALKTPNISALQDRSKLYWQVTPQNIRPKRFQRVYTLLSGETLEKDLLSTLEEQIVEEEEDRAKLLQEERFAKYPVTPAGDLTSPCFVDRLKLNLDDPVLTRALSAYGAQHELAGGFPEKLAELGAIRYLSERGYRFDIRAILDGKGHRGSILNFTADTKIIMNRVSRVDFQLTLIRDGVQLADLEERLRNVSTLHNRSVTKDLEKVTYDYFSYYAPSCDEALELKKGRRVSTFF